MAIAKTTFGKLMEIWKATEISLKQKLRLYNAAVISIVSFGFETWEMPQKLEDSLRGWNARCLAAITGREISQEHRQPTFDLIAKLRARRLKWAGQILRQEPEDSLVHQVLMATAIHDLAAGNKRRSLLMDAVEYTTSESAIRSIYYLLRTARRHREPTQREKDTGRYQAMLFMYCQTLNS